MSSSTTRPADDIYLLDEMVRDVYNIFYAKTAPFSASYIDNTKIDLSRFKFSDYSMDEIFDKTPLQFVGDFPTGIEGLSEYRFRRQSPSEESSGRTTIHLVPYPDKESLEDPTQAININQIIRTTLSELVALDRSDNVILPIINVDVSRKDLENFKEVLDRLPRADYYSVQITERFYRTMTLQEFLDSYPLTPDVLRYLIHQAIDVLYRIQIYFRRFRYNLFLPPYLECYLQKGEEDVVMPKLKLSNYYLAEMPHIKNSAAKALDLFYDDSLDDTYYDLFQLLNYFWIRHEAVIREDLALLQMFQKMLPEELRGEENLTITEPLWKSISPDVRSRLNVKQFKMDEGSGENISPIQSLTTIDEMARNTDIIEEVEKLGIPDLLEAEVEFDVSEDLMSNERLLDSEALDAFDEVKEIDEIEDLPPKKSLEEKPKNISNDIEPMSSEEMSMEHKPRKEKTRKSYKGQRRIYRRPESKEPEGPPANYQASHYQPSYQNQEPRKNSLQNLFGITPTEASNMQSQMSNINPNAFYNYPQQQTFSQPMSQPYPQMQQPYGYGGPQQMYNQPQAVYNQPQANYNQPSHISEADIQRYLSQRSDFQ